MGRFQRGRIVNVTGRPKGGTTPILASIKKEFGGEPEFWNHLAKAAKSDDQNCVIPLVARVCPIFKARFVCIELDMKGDRPRTNMMCVLQGNCCPMKREPGSESVSHFKARSLHNEQK